MVYLVVYVYVEGHEFMLWIENEIVWDIGNGISLIT